MDKELTKSGVFFLPWIGERFSASNGTRLLILGESHYGDAKGETPDLTRNCVSQHASRTWNHRFFTMLTQLVTGEDHFLVDRQAFLAKVSFYNYVQRSVADSWGVAPSDDDFARNESALRAVIERLNPTHVLVCSWRLWDNLPSTLFAPTALVTLSERFQIWSMNTEPAVLSMGIPHPSRAAREQVAQHVSQFLSYKT